MNPTKIVVAVVFAMAVAACGGNAQVTDKRTDGANVSVASSDLKWSSTKKSVCFDHKWYLTAENYYQLRLYVPYSQSKYISKTWQDHTSNAVDMCVTLPAGTPHYTGEYYLYAYEWHYDSVTGTYKWGANFHKEKKWLYGN